MNIDNWCLWSRKINVRFN